MKSKLVKESLNEDIIDKVRERRFGILDDNDEYEDIKFLKNHDKDIVVYDDVERGWKLIKNPSSLRYIGDDVRAVCMKNGDLYVENKTGVCTHQTILFRMYKVEILSRDYERNWNEMLPKEFLTIQRNEDTNEFLIGESNEPFPHGYAFDSNNFDEVKKREKKKKEILDTYDKFLEPVRKKNPAFKFSLELH